MGSRTIPMVLLDLHVWCSEVHGAGCMVHDQKWAHTRGAMAARAEMGTRQGAVADMRRDGQDLGCFGESVARYDYNAEEKT